MGATHACHVPPCCIVSEGEHSATIRNHSFFMGLAAALRLDALFIPWVDPFHLWRLYGCYTPADSLRYLIL